LEEYDENRVGMEKTDEWIMNAEFVPGIDPERQDYALFLFASWLARIIIRRMDVEGNTALEEDDSSQPALTSEPINCTVGTLSSCKTEGSNK
jgi:hypothetical protein